MWQLGYCFDSDLTSINYQKQAELKIWKRNKIKLTINTNSLNWKFIDFENIKIWEKDLWKLTRRYSHNNWNSKFKRTFNWKTIQRQTKKFQIVFEGVGGQIISTFRRCFFLFFFLVNIIFQRCTPLENCWLYVLLKRKWNLDIKRVNIEWTLGQRWMFLFNKLLFL